ncbi:MAG: TVP38/TMEM64 family protein [Micrococcus sp.]|nr:TVP38/TMEM64 family protein [Micrococcus sp.]
MMGTPRRDSGIDWGTWARNTALIVLILSMVWLALNVDLPSLDTIRERIDSFGWAGWLVFAAAYALVAITPIPVTIMAVSGGAIFGVWVGFALSLIGVTVGSYIAYWLARALGHETVARLLGSRAERIEAQLRDDAGVLAMSTMRLMPGVPYWPVNYGAGAFGATQSSFLTATVLASAPGQLSLVAVGAILTHQNLATLIVLIAAWVAVVVLTIWAYRRWRRAQRSGPEA